MKWVGHMFLWKILRHQYRSIVMSFHNNPKNHDINIQTKLFYVFSIDIEQPVFCLCFKSGTWARILVQVTIYRRLLIGRDGHLDQSEAYDIS